MQHVDMQGSCNNYGKLITRLNRIKKKKRGERERERDKWNNSSMWLTQ